MTTWSSSPVDMSGHVGGTRFINCILCSISQARLSRPFQDPLCASNTAKAAIYSNSNKSWVQLEGTDDLLLLLFLQASVSVESLSCRQTSFFCQARRMCSLLPTARKGARDCNLTLWCAEISNSFIPEWFHENDNWTAMQCLPQARRGCWLNNRNFHDGRCWRNLPRPYWQVADRRIASDTQ